MHDDGADPAGGTAVAEAVTMPGESTRALWRGRRNQYMLDRASGHHKWLAIWSVVTFGTAYVLLVLGGVSAWRVGVMVGAQIVLVALQGAIIATVRLGQVESAFVRIAGVSQLFVITCTTLTGGLTSPFGPLLAVSAAVPLVFFGPHPVARRLMVLMLAMAAVVALLPTSITGPGVPAPYHHGVVLVSLVWSLVAFHTLIERIAAAAAAAAHEVDVVSEARIVDAEAQQRRLRAVSSRVAHELKNPLASIKGLVQLVQSGPGSERSGERLGVALSEIERVERILREYLSFARPLDDLALTAADLAEVARDAAATVAGRAAGAEVELALELEAVALRGDPRRLHEAVVNLLANAIEATPPGGTITLRSRRDGAIGELTVHDTGRGMSGDHLARLGTAFFTTRADGTGLGVVLAQGVVAQHGGALSYHSAVGAGTRATLRLPLAPARPAGEPDPARASAEPADASLTAAPPPAAERAPCGLSLAGDATSAGPFLERVATP